MCGGCVHGRDLMCDGRIHGGDLMCGGRIPPGLNTRNEDVDSGGTKAMKAAISGPAPIEQAMDAESKMTEVPGPETVRSPCGDV